MLVITRVYSRGKWQQSWASPAAENDDFPGEKKRLVRSVRASICCYQYLYLQSPAGKIETFLRAILQIHQWYRSDSMIITIIWGKQIIYSPPRKPLLTIMSNFWTVWTIIGHNYLLTLWTIMNHRNVEPWWTIHDHPVISIGPIYLDRLVLNSPRTTGRRGPTWGVTNWGLTFLGM